MSMFVRIRSGRWASGTVAALAIVLTAGLLLAAPAEGPTSWDVRLTVTARGEYGLEGRDVRVGGRYEFTIVWSGALHVDDEDYLLVHGGTTVMNWTAEERSLSSERVDVLTTTDFPDKPDLRVNYILKMEDGLHVDFIVHGFDVPLGDAGDTFYLHLPASAENAENPGGLKYGLSLVSGSNAVTLDEKKIHRGPAEETFRWSWRRRGWIQRQEQTILEANRHDVEVRVVIIPK
jgi:hypothetical protein